MKIGIVSATGFEIQPTIEFLASPAAILIPHEFEILITGVGSMATAYKLATFTHSHAPECMIQAGIGGAFTKKLLLGTTYMIGDEILGDLGAAENNLFNDMFDLGLMESSSPPFTNKRLVNPNIKGWEQYGLSTCTGVTVNEITTLQTRIDLVREKYQCDIESMEGAAFHYVCLQENIPFIQLRSVSNYIGERDKNNWKLQDSIDNLNHNLINIIRQIP